MIEIMCLRKPMKKIDRIHTHMKKTEKPVIDTRENNRNPVFGFGRNHDTDHVYYTHVKSKNVRLKIQERQSIANEIYKGLSCLSEENVDKPSPSCSKNPENAAMCNC